MAYAFPTDDDLTMLACAAHKDRMPEFKADPEAAMARAFDRGAGRASPRPRQARLAITRQARRAQRRRRPTGPGLALVGDARPGPARSGESAAAGRCRAAEWLADEVGPALGDVGRARPRPAALRRRHRGALADHDQRLLGLSSGRSSTRPRGSSSARAARDDELAGRFALVGERWSASTAAPPSRLGLMLRANLAASPGAAARAGVLRRHTCVGDRPETPA